MHAWRWAPPWCFTLIESATKSPLNAFCGNNRRLSSTIRGDRTCKYFDSRRNNAKSFSFKLAVRWGWRHRRKRSNNYANAKMISSANCANCNMTSVSGGCARFSISKMNRAFNVNHLTVISHRSIIDSVVSRSMKFQKPFKLRLLWLPSFFLRLLCAMLLSITQRCSDWALGVSLSIALCTHASSASLLGTQTAWAALWDTDRLQQL